MANPTVPVQPAFSAMSPPEMGPNQSRSRSSFLPLLHLNNPPIVASKTHPPYDVPFFANAVYYPNWRVYNSQPPSSFRLGFVSHVFYAFAWVKPDGTVYLSDEYADCQIHVDGTNGLLRALIQAKQQNPQLRVILSVGGGGPASHAFGSVASNPIAVDEFIYTARTLMDEYELDGIDIDWEYPNNFQEGINYVNLLARLRDRLPAPRYTLTTALPANVDVLSNIDLAAAQPYLDFINIMAYDFSGPWTQLTGYHAQLFAPSKPHSNAERACGSAAVHYVLQHGVPSQKILLGIPVYGRSFLGASQPGQQYRSHAGEEGTFEYRDLPRPSAVEVCDKDCAAAACVGGDGGFVSYDNTETVKMKAKFATDMRLGGLFYWHIGGDKKGAESLIENGYNTLHELA